MTARFIPPVPAHPGRRPASIGFAELPVWVPGDILCASDDLGWNGVNQRTYRYHGQDVEIPPMDCFMVVQYEDGYTPMDRQFDGRWTRTACAAGHFSLLSNAADSHWHWTEGIAVSHVYLDNQMMCRLASELAGRPVEQVCLHDVLSGADPVVTQLAQRLRLEASAGQPGCAMVAEALSLHLGVHLLRHYAVCKFRAPDTTGRLTAAQLRRLREHVDAHLAGPTTLQDMAQALGLGVCSFTRMLRASLGTTAHRYVVDRRVERAQQLLKLGDLPLKAVAAATGFADQAHMTRTLRARLGQTPGQLRGRA